MIYKYDVRDLYTFLLQKLKDTGYPITREFVNVYPSDAEYQFNGLMEFVSFTDDELKRLIITIASDSESFYKTFDNVLKTYHQYLLDTTFARSKK